MKITGSIVLLVCGIVAFVGIFLPWSEGFGISISLWEIFSEADLQPTTDSFLLFIGSILLFVSALSAVIVSANPKLPQKVLLSFFILVSLGAALGIGGASWHLFDAINWDYVEFLGYGFYISYVAVILGLVFGINTIITSQRSGFQLTFLINKLSIGLVLIITGILLDVIWINISANWSMEYLGQVMIVLLLGGLLVLVGLILLVIYFISWLKKRK